MARITIHLKDEEREFLREFLKKGTRKARAIARANVLLLLDGGYDTATISKVLNVHRQRVWRIKRQYLDEGLMPALEEKPRSGQPRKYTEKHDAEIIAQACTKPPNGRKRWSIELLVEALRKKKGFETINRESIRLVLKKAELSLG